MSTDLTTLFGAIGVVAAMLAVILPAIRAQGTNLRSEIAAQGRAIETLGTSLRSEISAVRGDVAELRRDVHDLSDRVSRIEGMLNVPGRTTNGAPEPAGSGAAGDRGVAE